MTADAQSMQEKAGPPKRRFRNYLLDTRFQLKYTGAVVLVTVLVASAVGLWLGREVYTYSTGMSQMLLMQDMGEAVDEAQLEQLEEESRAEDAKVLRNVVMGIVALVLILAIALGFTGIIVTHKVVGPAYKLKLLLGDVASGKLNIRGGFRKGDELQDVGEAFKSMVKALRDRQEEEIAQIEEILALAERKTGNAELVAKIRELKGRMQSALDD